MSSDKQGGPVRSEETELGSFVEWILEKVSQNGKWSVFDAWRQEQEDWGQEVESQEALLYKPPAKPPFCKVNRGKMQCFLVVMATPRIHEVCKRQS